MSTPEGRVKAKVKAGLKTLPRCHPHWPVQNGMGAPTLDNVTCVNGYYVAIETKVRGKKPTARQDATIASMRAAGAIVFVLDDDDVAGPMADWKWLNDLKQLGRPARSGIASGYLRQLTEEL